VLLGTKQFYRAKWPLLPADSLGFKCPQENAVAKNATVAKQMQHIDKQVIVIIAVITNNSNILDSVIQRHIIKFRRTEDPYLTIVDGSMHNKVASVCWQRLKI
jgi:hypothetical protein